MISRDLRDYVRTYPDHLPQDLCERACDQLDQAQWTQHAFYHSRDDRMVSYDNELSISYDEIDEQAEINRRVWFAVERYILQDFVDFHDWFNGWNGYTAVRFNRYDPTTQMRLHCDHIHSMFDGQRRGIPILTVLGALNRDYTGGELVMWGDHRIDLEPGAVVVFPSNFMFPHEVRPVITGRRYSYVSWTW